MRDEWLEPPAYENPVCPVCECECETIYMNGNDVIGCNECITVKDAYDWQTEEKERIKDERADMAYEYQKEQW